MKLIFRNVKFKIIGKNYIFYFILYFLCLKYFTTALMQLTLKKIYKKLSLKQKQRQLRSYHFIQILIKFPQKRQLKINQAA